MESRPKDSFPVTLAYIALLGFVYAITGKLALMLAIPPGYATAIFPPAGIALTALLLWGCRLWPGVFLGSVMLNLWIGFEHGPLTISGMQIAVSAASGASLQALAGAWLVRRFIGFPTSLSKAPDILKFMILAGPVACMLNATFGVTAIYLSGFVAPTDYAFSWFTWWVGDSIGVLITAPLLLILFGKPRELWWGRRTIVALPLLLTFSAVISLFYFASIVEQNRIEGSFKEIAIETHQQVSTNFQDYLDSVAYIERFISSSQQVTRKDFRNFVAYTLANKPGIQGLSWNPVIPQSGRARFEQTVRNEGFPGFQITERDSNNKLVRAAIQDEYVAVQYIEPMNGNEHALGFNVASNSERRSTLMQARDTGFVVATPKINLVQQNVSQSGFLIFQPVYAAMPKTVEDRRQALRGFVVGVFRIADIVDVSMSTHYKTDVSVSIYDDVEGKSVLIYGPEAGVQGLAFHDVLEIAGRHWHVTYWPTQVFMDRHKSWNAWGVLALGLLFTSLLGAFLLFMTGSSYQTERLVARRTAELRGILTTALDAIITVDASGNIETVNPACVAMLGYAEQELIGASIHNVIPDFFGYTAQEATADVPLAMDGRRDAYALKKDGARIPVGLAISTVALADKTLHTAIVHDLTERQKIDRMKDEFISTVSHELRTPLTSISGVLGLIKGGALDSTPEKIRPMLSMAYDNCSRLTKLVDDLLVFNKNTLAASPLKLGIISVNTLIDHAVKANQGYAAKYDIALAWIPDAEPAYLNIDEDKLIQVLSNLLSNAIKYSPKGGQVTLTTSHSATEVRIAVADYGSGIPLAFQDRVFEKFAQADSSDTRRVGGTGLGMAIAKSLVEVHHGRISFVSQPGQGTTFFIDLPRSVPAKA